MNKFWKWFTRSTKLLYVCKIPVRWTGLSKVIGKGVPDELMETITVHVYTTGYYEVFQESLCDMYQGFAKYKHAFEAYKQTDDIVHIQKWIVWKEHH